MSQSIEGRRVGGIVKVMQAVFRRMAAAESIEPGRYHEVLPVYFLGWTGKQLEEGRLDPDEIVTGAGAQHEDWTQLLRILENAAGVEMIQSVWPLVVLGDRPAPEHEVREASNIFMVKFADGVTYTVRTVVDRRSFTTSKVTDGELVGLLASQRDTPLAEIGRLGVDGCHAQGQDLRGQTPEDPLDVVTGLILHKMLPQINPDYHQLIKRHLSLWRTLVKTPEARAAPPAGPAKTQGGWDA
jgi:hypothetical protein